MADTNAAKAIHGEVVDFGSAPYQNNPANKVNFYVTLKQNDNEKTFWGNGLSDAIKNAEIVKGDIATFVDKGVEEVNVQDGNGKFISAKKRFWDAEKYEPPSSLQNTIEVDNAPVMSAEQAAELAADTETSVKLTKGELASVDTERNRDIFLPENIENNYIAVIKNRFLKDKKTHFYDKADPKTVAFEDRSTSLATSKSDEKTIKAMLDLAQSKSWKAIQIKGDPEFKKQMWLEANIRGIETKGFNPTEADKAELQAIQEGRTNNTLNNDVERSKVIEEQEARNAEQAAAELAAAEQAAELAAAETTPTAVGVENNNNEPKQEVLERLSDNPDYQSVKQALDLATKDTPNQAWLNEAVSKKFEETLIEMDDFSENTGKTFTKAEIADFAKKDIEEVARNLSEPEKSAIFNRFEIEIDDHNGYGDRGVEALVLANTQDMSDRELPLRYANVYPDKDFESDLSISIDYDTSPDQAKNQLKEFVAREEFNKGLNVEQVRNELGINDKNFEFKQDIEHEVNALANMDGVTPEVRQAMVNSFKSHLENIDELKTEEDLSQAVNESLDNYYQDSVNYVKNHHNFEDDLAEAIVNKHHEQGLDVKDNYDPSLATNELQSEQLKETISYDQLGDLARQYRDDPNRDQSVTNEMLDTAEEMAYDDLDYEVYLGNTNYKNSTEKQRPFFEKRLNELKIDQVASPVNEKLAHENDKYDLLHKDLEGHRAANVQVNNHKYHNDPKPSPAIYEKATPETKEAVVNNLVENMTIDSKKLLSDNGIDTVKVDLIGEMIETDIREKAIEDVTSAKITPPLSDYVQCANSQIIRNLGVEKGIELANKNTEKMLGNNLNVKPFTAEKDGRYAEIVSQTLRERNIDNLTLSKAQAVIFDPDNTQKPKQNFERYQQQIGEQLYKSGYGKNTIEVMNEINDKYHGIERDAPEFIETKLGSNSKPNIEKGHSKEKGFKEVEVVENVSIGNADRSSKIATDKMEEKAVAIEAMKKMVHEVYKDSPEKLNSCLKSIDEKTPDIMAGKVEMPQIVVDKAPQVEFKVQPTQQSNIDRGR